MYVCFGFLLSFIVTGYDTNPLNVKDISKANDEIYLTLDEAAAKGLSLANQAKIFAEDVVRSQVIYKLIIQMLILVFCSICILYSIFIIQPSFSQKKTLS